jgi:hypothetical protein
MTTWNIVVYKEGFTFGDRQDVEADREVLSRLYRKQLDSLPVNVDPSLLGLDAILGLQPLATHTAVVIEGTQVINRTDLVRFINSTIITHRIAPHQEYTANTVGDKQIVSEGYVGVLRTVFGGYAGNVLLVLDVQEDYFSAIVGRLGKTVGLHALRRILLSLLYYIKTNECVRADLFACTIEEYLDKHMETDDDSVVELSLSY